MDQTYKIKIRLFSSENLKLEKKLNLNSNDTHYLKSVMRCKIGDNIYLFNEKDGEYKSKIINYNKKIFELVVLEKTNKKEVKFDLHMIFSPLKRDNTEYIVQKATELGVSEISPVLTDRTIVRKLNYDRLFLIAKEASELSHRLSVPKINILRDLKNVIDHCQLNRTILHADENIRERINFKISMNKLNSKKGAILIGPEGGFSHREITFLKSKKNVLPISLGEKILRADTAAVVGLSYWHFLNVKIF